MRASPPRAGASALLALGGVALLAGACQPERSAANAVSSGAAARPAPTDTPYVPDPTGPFVRFEGGGVPPYTLERERGIGVVHFEPGPALAGRVADTLDVRVRPESAAGVLARLVLDTSGVYVFEAREGALARPGALDFGYEEIGFPILEHGAGGWEHVYVGSAPDRSFASGWARARPTVVGVTLWNELIPGQPLFFALPPDSIRFYDAPEGVETRFAVQADDYILWPLDVRGDWMRVRAASPSDYCALPGARPPAAQDTLWIRWRGATGRPRVWFFTKGC